MSIGDLSIQEAWLNAAIAHARKNAFTPKDRRECVLFFLQVELRALKRSGQYRVAWEVQSLLSKARMANLLITLLGDLRREQEVAGHADGDPHCNTGPTTQTVSEELMSFPAPAKPTTVKAFGGVRRRARVYDA